MDVTDSRAVEDLTREVVAAEGRVDVLYNAVTYQETHVTFNCGRASPQRSSTSVRWAPSAVESGSRLESTPPQAQRTRKPDLERMGTNRLTLSALQIAQWFVIGATR